jgi:GNAT superfamily N-acetyltransferase
MAAKLQQQSSDRNPPTGKDGRVEVIPYEPAYRDDFRCLNIEWLEKYFRVEEKDQRVLTDPETYILDNGGCIFFARIDSNIVGTAALIKAGKGRYELSKMSVTASHQGLGIGRKLAEATIRHFEEIGGSELYLESNRRLTPALTLYESMGFVHRPVPEDSEYERADVYMVYRPRERP